MSNDMMLLVATMATGCITVSVIMLTRIVIKSVHAYRFGKSGGRAIYHHGYTYFFYKLGRKAYKRNK